MDDFYKVLGLQKSASEEQIRQAYKKLAREHHPDKGGDKEKFQQIQTAYETLGDEQKRRDYDTPAQNPFNFNSHFSTFFEHNTAPRNETRSNHNYVCKVSLKDVYFGTLKKFKVKRENFCIACRKSCSNCNGRGVIRQTIQMGPLAQIINHQCSKCNGSGELANLAGLCTKCNSTRINVEERLIEISIEKGVENGKKYVFQGWGEQPKKTGEIPGNLIVIIQIEPHDIFTRIGNDLSCTIKLSLRESIVGKQVTIEHFDGPLVIETIGFGIVNPNKHYYMLHKGLPGGNLQIRFTIEYPTLTLDNNQKDVLANAFQMVGI